MSSKPLSRWWSGAIVLAGFAALTWLERRRPLRPATEPKLRHGARNLAIAAAGGVVVTFLEMPVVAHFTALAQERHAGALQWLDLPWWIEVPAAVLLIDYTMYWWHWLNHRVPVMWRTHLPHHVDLDLDASTALRFHFTEMLTTVPLRVVQIGIIGAGPLAFSIWQTLFALSILFHHSKVELPIEWERRLVWLVVTPRMHGIHHSIVQEETNSNLSSGLTLWDRLHGTLRLNVPQAEVTIGVPGYRRPDEVTLPKVLALPFTEIRDGKAVREASPVPVTMLLA